MTSFRSPAQTYVEWGMGFATDPLVFEATGEADARQMVARDRRQSPERRAVVVRRTISLGAWEDQPDLPNDGP